MKKQPPASKEKSPDTTKELNQELDELIVQGETRKEAYAKLLKELEKQFDK